MSESKCEPGRSVSTFRRVASWQCVDHNELMRLVAVLVGQQQRLDVGEALVGPYLICRRVDQDPRAVRQAQSTRLRHEASVRVSLLMRNFASEASGAHLVPRRLTRLGRPTGRGRSQLPAHVNRSTARRSFFAMDSRQRWNAWISPSIVPSQRPFRADPAPTVERHALL